MTWSITTTCVARRTIPVEAPRDSKIKKIIDRLAEFVARSGFQLEQAIMRRESDNSDYDFLRDVDSYEANYYRSGDIIV